MMIFINNSGTFITFLIPFTTDSLVFEFFVCVFLLHQFNYVLLDLSLLPVLYHHSSFPCSWKMRSLFDAMWYRAKHKKWAWKERVMFGVMTFVFPSNPHLWWSPAFLDLAKHLLAVGSGELISCSTLLVCAAITWPVRMTLIQPKSFLTFTLLIPTPTPAGVWYLNHSSPSLCQVWGSKGSR